MQLLVLLIASYKSSITKKGINCNSFLPFLATIGAAMANSDA